ncbi:MAG TPA: hypothetical protein VLQ78_00015 [Ornithinibacter sp.]|nr:hypothetical protein [Ornithinibacter sp.]
MNPYADPLFLRAEIDRRLELFGVGDEHHPTSSPARRPGSLGRLADRALRALRPTRPTVAAPGSPRHP